LGEREIKGIGGFGGLLDWVVVVANRERCMGGKGPEDWGIEGLLAWIAVVCNRACCLGGKGKEDWGLECYFIALEW